MGCSTRPYNLMPPKRRPSNRQAQAGGCRRPGGGDPTSKASPLAQDASISNGAEARAHHPLTPICPLELKGISKAERAGTACPPRKGWGMWHWERSLPASPTSFTRRPSCHPPSALPALWCPQVLSCTYFSIFQAGSQLWKVWMWLLTPCCCSRLRGWLGGWPGDLVLTISTSPSSSLFALGFPFQYLSQPGPGMGP